MFDVAIFAALGWERRAVTDVLGSVAVAGPQRWTAAIDGGAGTCLVVQTGIGQERARAAVRGVPEARLFVSCGCAGALVDWLRPGDVVLASGIIRLDRESRPSEALSADASLAGWAMKRGFRIHVGQVVSTETVLESAPAKCEAAASGGLVVEMEGAAVAAEARTRGIPFVDLRVVLDVRGQAVPPLDVLDEATGEIRRGRAAVTLAFRPWVWPAVARLGRQTRVADRALRTIMGAVLEGGLPATGSRAAAVAVS